MSRTQGPQFVGWFAPLLEALRELGDSGRPKEVSARIAERLGVSDEELNATNKNGLSRFDNQVAWARFYLARAGLIDTSQRGVWTLTEEGRRTMLDSQGALEVFQRVQRAIREEKVADPTLGPLRFGSDIHDEAIQVDADSEYNPKESTFYSEMIHTLQALSPSGFEHPCKKLLREVGFEEVHVTGKSSDGGIDGFGILRTNPFVADRVLFQCKRYTKQVSPAYIREFRGAMANRVNRGIFLATSTFSAEARREASREGAAPIELVDLDALINLLEELGLGVTKRTVLSVDAEFFRDYLPEKP